MAQPGQTNAPSSRAAVDGGGANVVGAERAFTPRASRCCWVPAPLAAHFLRLWAKALIHGRAAGLGVLAHGGQRVLGATTAAVHREVRYILAPTANGHRGRTEFLKARLDL